LADAKAEASQERSEATKANVELEKQVGELKALRAGDVESFYSKASGYFTKAASAARDSVVLAPGSGKATQGDAQTSIAELHWNKASGLKNFALLMESLAAAEPALPKRAEYADAGKAAREQAKQELESAATALDAAKAAFTSARASGDAKEKLTKLGELLDTAIKVSREQTQGVSADLAVLTGKGAAPAPAAAAGGNTPAPEAPAGADANAGVKASVDALAAAAASGTAADFFALCDVPADAKATLSRLTAKAARVENAMKAKFGSADKFKGGNQMGGGFDLDKFKTLKSADLTYAVNGDQATVSGGTLTSPLQFKKVDSKWLYSDPMFAMIGPQMAMAAPMMPVIEKMFDDFAGEIEAGKYASEDEAMKAFMQKMMSMMQQGGPPGGPKKGPGGGGGG
jgi:hypothetical protein